MPKTPIGHLRLIGAVEAVSFLFLLGIAMPLKYLADSPMAVKIGGWCHGLLFVAFCWALLIARKHHDWSARRTLTILVAALVPFGPFIIDPGLKAEEQQRTGGGS